MLQISLFSHRVLMNDFHYRRSDSDVYPVLFSKQFKGFKGPGILPHSLSLQQVHVLKACEILIYSMNLILSIFIFLISGATAMHLSLHLKSCLFASTQPQLDRFLVLPLICGSRSTCSMDSCGRGRCTVNT